jgi:outer membrane protein W
LAHITEITGTTTKTITIDEGLTAITNGTFTFSVEKWKLVNFDINNNKFSSKASLKDEKLESTQLKVEINKHTLEEIQVSNVPNYSIKKI